MYRQEKNTVGLQTIQKLRGEMSHYFEVGKEMAQSYIDEGPAGGNKKMANFDAAAEVLISELEPFIAKQTGEVRGELEAMQTMANSLKTGIIVICLLVTLFVAVVAWLLIRSIG